MRSKSILVLITVSLIGLTLYSCKQENIDVLKANLDQAIKESNLLESSRLLDNLIKRGVSPETLPVKEVTDLVIMECFDVYEWDPINGKELVQLYGPIEGMHDGTWMEYVIRGSYFWGLMDIGQRQKALELWKKSEEAMSSLLETPYFLDRETMSREEIILLQNQRWGFWFFTVGFLSSRKQEDKHRSIELAKKNYDWALRSVEEEVKDTQLSHPVAQAQIMQVLSDNPYALLEYCIVESGMPVLIHSLKTSLRLISCSSLKKKQALRSVHSG
jgi:hypothetical protein